MTVENGNWQINSPVDNMLQDYTIKLLLVSSKNAWQVKLYIKPIRK